MPWLMVDLASRLVLPDPMRPETMALRPRISTDGFAPYPDAVEQAFA